MNSKKTSKSYWWIWLLVFIVILVVVGVYVATLGTVDLTGKEDLPKELADSREQAIKRHAELKKEIDKKIELKNKLTKKFKFVYAAVRLSLVAIWLGGLYLLYHFNFITSIGDALNYSEASLFLIF